MVRKTEKGGTFKCPLQDEEYGKKKKIMEKEKHPLEHLKNDEITEK